MEQTFGKLIRQARKDKGYSQRQLAGLLSVDFTYLSKLENDRADYPQRGCDSGIGAKSRYRRGGINLFGGSNSAALREFSQAKPQGNNRLISEIAAESRLC